MKPEFLASRSLPKKLLSTLLVGSYGAWSRLLPDRYQAYECPGGQIFLNIRESPMMLKRAVWRFERHKFALLEKVLQPGNTFIDVGCNKGDFALFAATLVGHTGRVFAVEPDNENCLWIGKSIELNHYQNIDLFPLALSDHEGEGTLHLGKKSGHHSLIGGVENLAGTTAAVPLKRLDTLVRESAGPQQVDVIKIDVEGAERQVLDGARDTLESNPHLALFLDIHRQHGVDPAQIHQDLKGLGFHCYPETGPFTRALPDLATTRSVFATRMPPDQLCDRLANATLARCA
ncbi:MAG: FkbM family methyltransferase [Pirellulales bacterium]